VGKQLFFVLKIKNEDSEEPAKGYNWAMRITQLHKKNYIEFNDEYQLVLPLSLEGVWKV
jgi:hypothetical protein